MSPGFTLVIPTVGRPSLRKLLDSLEACPGPRPEAVVIVDDRRDRTPALPLGDGWAARSAVVLGTGGRGPAAARNAGRLLARTEWVAFLDDDVLVTTGWLNDLAQDLTATRAAGSQGRVVVPLPTGRRPTDAERGTAGLQHAAWITADMAYRTDVLDAVGGFDERFPRAFREDADLALRVQAAGHRLERGRRTVHHPVRPSRWYASVGQQRGNADDALMRRLHGPGWGLAAAAPPGRRGRHVAACAAALLGAGAALAGRRRLAAVSLSAGIGVFAEFAAARIAPGPRTPREVTTMLVTSVLIPPVAVLHWVRGAVRHRSATPWRAGVDAVLFDRDGTLVYDVPYNGDPDRVAPMPGAREAVDRLRAAGIRVGVVTNQSGIARGRLTRDQVDAVNRRIDRELGGFGSWQVCPHWADDRCDCRKPAPGLVRRAADALGVDARRCVVVGDIQSDVHAAAAAGARSVLVPTPATRPEEVAAAPLVAADLAEAVELILRPNRALQAVS